MCIRDRNNVLRRSSEEKSAESAIFKFGDNEVNFSTYMAKGCLLYTSDAADERSSVDLGGRRIIKKKKTKSYSRTTLLKTQKKQ